MIPANANPLLIAGGADPLDEYQVIGHSVRFNSPDGPFFHRTIGAGADRKKGALSIWIKPTKIVTTVISDNGNMHLFHAHNGSDIAGAGVTAYSRLVFVGDGTNALNRLQWQSIGSAGEAFTSNALYRDLSAHGHLYVRWDSTIPLFEAYWNGVEISYASRTLPTLNADTMMGLVSSFMMLCTYTSVARFFDGYLSMPHVILGSAPPVTHFGAVHPKTGQWRPKPYQGAFGVYDSFMDFADGSAVTSGALGKDRSGYNNDWTPVNFSVTAGIGNDYSLDTPTNNFCTLNPLAYPSGFGITLSEAALKATFANATYAKSIAATHSVSSGKWYFEGLLTGGGSSAFIGVEPDTSVIFSDGASVVHVIGYSAAGYGYHSTGDKRSSNADSAYGASYTTNDVVSVALDLDNGKIWFAKNGTWQAAGDPAAGSNAAYTGLSGVKVPGCSAYNGESWELNFGHRAFSYAPPAGFKALGTKNLLKASTVTVSGTFTGNANADGPCVLINGTPTTLTINGNAVTFGTHAEALAGGFKVRTASASYNASGANTWTATIVSNIKNIFRHQNARGN